jgi:hypothetical protein
MRKTTATLRFCGPNRGWERILVRKRRGGKISGEHFPSSEAGPRRFLLWNAAKLQAMEEPRCVNMTRPDELVVGRKLPNQRKDLAPRARFELATLRLTAEWVEILNALSCVAYRDT